MDYQASYLKLLEEGKLQERLARAKKELENCRLCPHECGVDRRKEKGVCQASDQALISSYGPHLGEERVLVGQRGSGTIFFGYCNLKCVYCQNYQLSFQGQGTRVSNEQLAEIMLIIQDHYKCHNINLVTPSHFVPNIIEAVYLAAEKGLKLPLVYNCGGYEKLETLKLLDGIVDIYMPDFKYNNRQRARKYSGVADYPQKARLALEEMDRQVAGLKTNNRGIAYQGLLIRHLMLPGGLEDSKEILQFIKDKLSPDVLVNLMNQYYPSHQAFQYKELRKRLSFREYSEVESFARELGLRLD